MLNKKIQAATYAPNGASSLAPSSRLRRVVVFFAATLASLAAPIASAYDFEVRSYDGAFHYVHITTASSACHDRNALDVNRGDQPQSDVSGSTASICLINGVQVSLGGQLYTWSHPGVAGGRWALMGGQLCFVRAGQLMQAWHFPGDC